jgi:amidase
VARRGAVARVYVREAARSNVAASLEGGGVTSSPTDATDDTAVKRLPRREPYEYEFVVTEPRLTVALGETFVVETEDAFNHLLQSEEQLPTPELLGQYDQYNPIAGPVVVEGVRAGDVLVVEIADIVPDDQGVSGLTEMWGPLHDSARYADCRGPAAKIIKHLPWPSGTTSDGVGVFDERISWDLKPMIGAIGTAPLSPITWGANSALGQGPFGGNVDSRDVRKGSKLLLPVAHDGGYLYLGDVHASMADGEFAGWANDTRAEVTLRCDVLPQKTIPWWRIETPTELIQLHSFKPLDRAIEQAFFWLVDWLVEDYGFGQRDAFWQMGVNPDVRINVYQMCPFGRLNYTVGVSIPKKYLSP